MTLQKLPNLAKVSRNLGADGVIKPTLCPACSKYQRKTDDQNG